MHRRLRPLGYSDGAFDECGGPKGVVAHGIKVQAKQLGIVTQI